MITKKQLEESAIRLSDIPDEATFNAIINAAVNMGCRRESHLGNWKDKYIWKYLIFKSVICFSDSPKGPIIKVSDILQPQFIVGRWYEITSSNFRAGEHYSKFLQLDFDGRFYFSEVIREGRYEKEEDWHCYKDSVREVSLEDIQQYLPDGHVDKIPKNTKFPTKWCIKLTSQEINDAVNSINLWKAGKLMWSDNGIYNTHYLGCDGAYDTNLPNRGYDVITLDQFKKHVLHVEYDPELEGRYIKCLDDSCIKRYPCHVGDCLKYSCTKENVEYWGGYNSIGIISGSSTTPKYFGKDVHKMSQFKLMPKGFDPNQKELTSVRYEDLTISDLIIGEFYFVKYTSGAQFIVEYGGGNRAGRYICLGNYSYSSGGTINNAKSFKQVTPEQRHWLTTSIKQNKFVPKDKLNMYDQKGNLINTNLTPRQTLKVGDWVYDLEDIAGNTTIGQISNIEGDTVYCDMWYSINGTKGNSGSTTNKLRLATPEEISKIPKSFEFGKWYKDTTYPKMLFFIEDWRNYYGFNSNGCWVSETKASDPLDQIGWIPASDSEVSARLLAYAQSTYPVGTKFKSTQTGNPFTVINNTHRVYSSLKLVDVDRGPYLMFGKKWAEIISEVAETQPDPSKDLKAYTGRFKKGDNVKVLREAESFEGDWCNSWTSTMSFCVGKVYTITDISNITNEGYLLAGYYFPEFVLELVKSASEPIESEYDMSNIITIAVERNAPNILVKSRPNPIELNPENDCYIYGNGLGCIGLSCSKDNCPFSCHNATFEQAVSWLNQSSVYCGTPVSNTLPKAKLVNVTRI